MPRDVLTLDVEIDPGSVMRQREALRMGLSSDLSGSISGIQGGPFGGMGPGTTGYPASGLGQTLGTALFPGFFAPPNSYVDSFEKSSQFYRERSFGNAAFDVGRSAFEMSGELAGGGIGAAAGSSLGAFFGGRPGALLGGIGGGLLGASLGGSAFGALGGEAQSILQGNQEIENTLNQLGYKSGLNILGEDGGSTKTRNLAASLAGDAAKNPLVALSGMDPRQLVSQVVSSGLQNNMYGQIDSGDTDQDLATFREAVNKDVQQTVRISQALRTTIQETRSIMADLKRGGVTDGEQETLEVGLLSSGFQFGADPSQLMTARNLGTQNARQMGIDGGAGGRETLIQSLRLAEARQQGFLGEETVQAGGGIGNLAAGIQSGANRQLGEGGILRDLLFASRSEGGGIDAQKFSQLSGRSALEIRQASARRFFSSKDPIADREQFDYDFPDLVKQLSNEDPGAIGQAFRLQIDRGARTLARTTGRQVTNATRFQSAQAFFGLDANQARAFTQSDIATSADDPTALAERMLNRADRDVLRRSQDPLNQARALTSRFREEVLAPGVSAATEGAAGLQRAFGGKVKDLISGVLGMENLSADDRNKRLDAGLAQLNKELESGDPSAPKGSAAAGGLKGLGVTSLGGSDTALKTLAARSGDVLGALNKMVDLLGSNLQRLKGEESKTAGGTNPATKTTGTAGSPMNGGQ